MPAISVVIPVHNGERFISETLQSALCQSFQDFEIIIIDDGSTDGSRKIIERFRGPIAYHYQSNRGVAAARNTGLSLAKGPWVAFLDSDDIWYANKLAVQMKYAERYPEVSFFYSDIDVIDEAGDITQRSLLTTESRRTRKNPRRTRRPTFVSVVFNDRPFPYPSTVFARTEMLLRAGGFNPRFGNNYHEDFEFFARVAHGSEARFIPESLIKYRTHPPPRDKSIRHQNWFILLQTLSELWRDDSEKHALLQRQYAKHYARLTRERLLAGDLRTAHKYFRQACGYRPMSWRGFWSWIVLFRPNRRDLHNLYTKWRSG
jgi:glycosyltransferase involved in cell wall biosynthesis